MAADAHAPALPRPRRSLGSLVMPAIALLLVALLVAWLAINLGKGPSYFVTIALIGLTNGALYALVALGYTLVYGILELINFAHGDVFMLGAMISYWFIANIFNVHDNPSMSTLLPAAVATLFIVMAICATINITIERIAYRPLRHAPRLAPQACFTCSITRASATTRASSSA